MNKYIIIKLPAGISLVGQVKVMEVLNNNDLDFQWYNGAAATDEELFV